MGSTKHSILVLCGGRGTRLSSVWGGPKILAPVGKVRFFDLLMSLLKPFEEKISITFATGYLSKDIETVLMSQPNLEFIQESEALGTGGAVKNYLENFNTDRVTVINGDTLYSPYDLNKYLNKVFSTRLNLMGFTILQSNSRFGSIEKDNLFLEIKKTKSVKSNPEVFCGIVTLNRSELDLSLSYPFSLEDLISQSKIKKSSFIRVNFSNSFLDIGTPDGLSEAVNWLNK